MIPLVGILWYSGNLWAIAGGIAAVTAGILFMFILIYAVKNEISMGSHAADTLWGWWFLTTAAAMALIFGVFTILSAWGTNAGWLHG